MRQDKDNEGVSEIIRRYRLDLSGSCYEDELPDDMTATDYDAWFAHSFVDFVRMGPSVERI